MANKFGSAVLLSPSLRVNCSSIARDLLLLLVKPRLSLREGMRERKRERALPSTIPLGMGRWRRGENAGQGKPSPTDRPTSPPWGEPSGSTGKAGLLLPAVEMDVVDAVCRIKARPFCR